MEEYMSHARNALKRVDAAGRAFAGSQRQIQAYVNEQPHMLQTAISDAFKMPLKLQCVSPHFFNVSPVTAS